MRSLVLACLFLLVNLSPGTASATPVDASYCVDYVVDYTDGATGDNYTGTEGPARGIKLEFTRPGAVAAIFFTDWTGAEPGCIDLTIDDAYTWTVTIVADALVNDSYVRVLDGIGGLPRRTTWLTDHVPADNVPYHTDLLGRVANVMAVSSYSLYRHNAGMYGETFNFVLEECNTPSDADDDILSSCYQPLFDEIRISDVHDHHDYKFLILHEMGHRVADLTNDDNGQDFDDEAVVGDCGPAYADDGHAMPTKEFSSVAATEGIAHFWAALALNDDGQDADCMTEKHYNPDWLQNGGKLDNEDVNIFSCSGEIVVDSVVIVEEFDYYGQYCDVSGAQTNRSTEYDWLRAFWDARTKGLLTGSDIYDIWNAADPNNWTINGTGTGGDFPAARMSSGAYAIGLLPMQVTWDTWAGFNGIDR